MEQASSHISHYLAQPKSTVFFNYAPVAQSPIPQHGYAPPPRVANTQTLPGRPADTSPRKSVITSLRWWWPEVLAALCALSALAAIVGVAQHYRGHSIEAAGVPSGLRLNGLIALLSTITRAALLIPVASALSQDVWLWLSEGSRGSAGRGELRDLEISDDASRGAWGSLLLLRHFRRSWLAYAGAIVTIVSLLVGTFTQQLITIKSFPIAETSLDNGFSVSPGNVPWSMYWQNFSGRPSEGPLSPPLILKAAAYSGMLSSTAFPLNADCPSGNCEWPTTPSLAICGGCVDSTFEISCNRSTILSSESNGGGESTSTATCVYKMPSGYTANLTNFAEIDMGVGFQVFQSEGSHYPSNDNNTLYLSNWEAVGAPANALGGTRWQNQTTVASECALWMCVQSFETFETVTNQQTQVVKESFSKIDTATRPARVLANDVSFLALPEDMNPPPNQNFSIFGLAALSLTEYFATLFDGNITLNQGEHNPSSDSVQAIWNSSADLNTWLQTVAGSMTNVIRTFDSGDHNEMYNGTGYRLGYDVQWMWLSLPAVLVASSLLILVVIMVKTARSPVQAWRGSPLALLFMNVDRELRDRAMGQLDRHGDVEKRVGKSHVSLGREKDGSWVLKQA